jgi:hypothetical protein
MRKPLRLVALATVLVAVAALPTATLAQNAHLKGRNPVLFNDNGLTLTATVSYAGLGNFDTQQNLTATAQPTADCVNPGSGEHRPPGQNPAVVTVTGSTLVSANDIKNGNVTISTTTSQPVTPIPGAPGCPNSNWIENITDMKFLTATITVFQDTDGNGTFDTLELTVNCTFNPPTSNGPVPTSNFTCTAS